MLVCRECWYMVVKRGGRKQKIWRSSVFALLGGLGGSTPPVPLIPPLWPPQPLRSSAYSLCYWPPQFIGHNSNTGIANEDREDDGEKNVWSVFKRPETKRWALESFRHRMCWNEDSERKIEMVRACWAEKWGGLGKEMHKVGCESYGGSRCSEENVEEVCGWGHEVYGYQGVCSAGSLCLEKCN